MRPYRLFLVGLLVCVSICPEAAVANYPVEFQDAAGRRLVLWQPPQRVVSIVPAVTEILFRIGAGDAVCGVTYHDTYPPQAATKPVIGGFFAPSLDRIEALQPDTIFIAAIHDTVIAAYADQTHPRLIQLSLNSLDDLVATVNLLGRIFDREQAAEGLNVEIKAEIAHTHAKTAPIPTAQRKRVMRLMGRDRIMTPGDDSFQNELIRQAGGIPPQLGKNGAIVPVTLDEWQTFNPQIVYGCASDRETTEKMLDQPDWREVDAVKNGRVIYFPCDLTCRLSSRSGYFVSCLASRIYADEFVEQPPVRPDGRVASRSLPVRLDYVGSAEVVDSIVNDYVHKTLLIHLNSPMAVVSTLEGFREQIQHVGNSYSPPQMWGRYHRIGLEVSRNQLLQSIGREQTDTSLLFTGADMDNLSVQRQQFKEMIVYALVTTGVHSNAVRMAEDVGAYYEPGTINMIILSNMQLTPRAMQRAIISATEAKTAALQDLDIRSSYTPLIHPATGTGTDNIIVVEGSGIRIDNAGGHSKMGELIAKAVYAGVQEAIFKQNGIGRQRHLIHRLQDRHISLFGLVNDCSCGLSGSQLTAEVERLLMEPAIAGFIEAALAISDAHERRLVCDLGSFAAWCDQTAEDIAGLPIPSKQVFGYSQTLPRVLKMAFDALLNGATARLKSTAVAP